MKWTIRADDMPVFWIPQWIPPFISIFQSQRQVGILHGFQDIQEWSLNTEKIALDDVYKSARTQVALNNTVPKIEIKATH